mmetsp:Transcript_41593/g.90216  ORF Transcript_41593/g.90216 Transcript_41593/m.90216 type:complete len:141 (-) Transcript_41593:92-514(-)
MGTFASCSASNLNPLILRADLTAVLRWLAGPQSQCTRAALCMMFGKVGASCLSVAAVAAVITSLPTADMFPRAPQRMLDILTSVCVDPLHAVKLRVGETRAGRKLGVVLLQGFGWSCSQLGTRLKQLSTDCGLLRTDRED